MIYKIKDWIHWSMYGRPYKMGSGGRQFKFRETIVRIASHYLPCNKTGEIILKLIMKITK